MLRTLTQFINTLDSTLKQSQIKDGETFGFSDLTISQLHYIEAIQLLNQPTISEVAETLRITKASATVGLKRLANLGYIDKRKSDQDKRVTHVSLTIKGEKLVLSKQNALNEYERKMVAALSSEESKQLENIMGKLVAYFNMQPD
jgi:DNA-binding MarR family transcriptional regulator